MSGAGELEVVASLAHAADETSTLSALAALSLPVLGADAVVFLLIGTDGSPLLLVHRAAGESLAPQVVDRPFRPTGAAAELLAGRLLLRLDRGDALLRSMGLTPTDHAAGPLLGVPMSIEGQIVGAAFVARHAERGSFGEPEELLTHTLAGVGAEVVHRVRRFRALEMLTRHLRQDDDAAADNADGSPAIRRLLASARDVVGTDLVFLSHLDGAREDVVYLDAAPDAPGLDEGISFPREEGYCSMVLAGTIPPSVPDLESNPFTAALPITRALGVGAYCGTPVMLPDGQLYGTLCGLSTDPSSPLTHEQLAGLSAIAAMIGSELAIEQSNQEQLGVERAAFLDRLGEERRSARLEPVVDLATGRQRSWRVMAEFVDPWGAPRNPQTVFDEAVDLGLARTLEHDDLVRMTQARHEVPAGSGLWLATSARAMLDNDNRALLDEILLEGTRDITLELIWSRRDVLTRRLRQILDELRLHGASLALRLDDAGLVQLDVLASIRPDAIVLDPLLTDDAESSSQARALVAALATMAVELEVALVALRMDRPEQLELMHALGVAVASGAAVRPSGPDAAAAGADEDRDADGSLTVSC
ncbi:EAL domain-containing protein [Nocardioides mangrovicus]|uniref:EAL domain-containing protein n=1 Tax=Nocardioides mangrovicus TaxID=2478913 RepID=A0A3L8P2I0_9ACTN|nr:EAL domain-containing protein [Nocardioides mangrovicus]RLV48638.1 EAL domain-containing protein [Nocardioides mangrovicus]